MKRMNEYKFTALEKHVYGNWWFRFSIVKLFARISCFLVGHNLYHEKLEDWEVISDGSFKYTWCIRCKKPKIIKLEQNKSSIVPCV